MFFKSFLKGTVFDGYMFFSKCPYCWVFRFFANFLLYNQRLQWLLLVHDFLYLQLFSEDKFLEVEILCHIFKISITNGHLGSPLPPTDLTLIIKVDKSPGRSSAG